MQNLNALRRAAATLSMSLLLCTAVTPAFSQVDDLQRIASRTTSVEHISIRSSLPFAQVRSNLEARIKRYPASIAALVADGDSVRARAELEQLALPTGLTILNSLNHGNALAMVDGRKNLMQYGIGNVLTATELTRHRPAAGLYAPIRVVLYEDSAGNTTFEYDRPSSNFALFGNRDIDKVAQKLDLQLQTLLLEVSR